MIKIEDIKKLAEATEEDDDEEIRIVEVKKEPKKKEPPAKMLDKDEDFYTRSMDLSDEDFEMESEFEDEKTSPLLKITLLFVFIAAIAITIYFVWKNFG